MMLKALFPVLLIAILICPRDVSGQCNSEATDALCIEKISQENIFVKSYKLNHQKRIDKEYSSVLAKDTEYYLNLCEEGQLSTNVVINVYNTKRKLIASNKTDDSVLPQLSFRCEKTGIYYFEFKASEGASECGLGALSFRRTASH